MRTQLVPFSPNATALAAQLLQAGQVVAIPTETVYGLAANALDGAAVQRIFAAKGRPQDNPLIVHIANEAVLYQIASVVPPAAWQLAKAFWPGPLTMVLPSAGTVAPQVSAGLPTVGVRMPAHPAALAVIQAAGLPLAAPSANVSGTPSPTTAAHVLADMDGRIPFVVDGGACRVGIESTVVSLVDAPVILRPGFITQQQLAQALGTPVAMAAAVTQPLAAGEAPASPGMKYRHYAPRAQLVLVQGGFEEFRGFLEQKIAEMPAQNPADNGIVALCFSGEEDRLPVPAIAYGAPGDEAAQAAGLFAALRALDEHGAKQVYARIEQADGVGLAVYNRLLRAAAFRVVHL